MTREATLRKSLDDAMQRYAVSDFNGGLVSSYDPSDIPPNAASDCENVRFERGRLMSRKGYAVVLDTLPADADGIFFFYDSAGARRLVAFSNGSVYDLTAETLTLVKASVYAAGNPITAAVLNGILYFSDGVTIRTSGSDDSGISYYDPVSSTSDTPMLISSGSGGTIETPAAKVLLAHNGQLVLANIKYVDSTLGKDSLLWSNVADPTTIVGTNIFKVGEGQGGEINCAVRFSVGAAGVSPYMAIFVGKSELGVYQLKGALSTSTLSEELINAPVGVLSGRSAKFVPKLNSIVWLATDRQVWATDGINSKPISEPIADELEYLAASRLSTSFTNFRAFLDYDDYHYVLDMGPDAAEGASVSYAYNWQLENWARWSGWPACYWVDAKDSTSNNVIYGVDDRQRLVKLLSNQDAGTDFTKYWESGWLNMGDEDLWKIFKWLYLMMRTDAGSVSYTLTVQQGRGDTATGSINPVDDTTDSGELIWGSGLWGVGLWGTAAGAAQPAYKCRERVVVASAGADGSPGDLSGANVKVRLSSSADDHFEVLGYALLYLMRGRERVAETQE